MIWPIRRALVFVALLVLGPHGVQAREIGPDEDWCTAANALPPGGELVLLAGDYQGPCTLRGEGGAGAPITIRAKDSGKPARIVYTGTSQNVLNIRAAAVTIRGLAFGPTHPNVDAIRIFGGHGITIEDCRFSDLGGIAVVANHSDVRNLTIRRNTILRSKSTAMYFGCHDGFSCNVSDLVIEQNFVSGVDSEEGIGYGIQIKLNSTAIIRDNVVTNTKGPGIMVYGATDPTRVSVVERNFVGGSRTSSAIVVGGGPAVVRNNIGFASAEAGIGLEDYGRRGLLRGIVVVHNTLYANSKGAIGLSPSSRLEAKLLNNAAHSRTRLRLLPAEQPGLHAAGNIDCSLAPCFSNPEELDFSPHPASPLLGRGRIDPDRWMPPEDYFGRRRGIPPTVGAVEGPGEPVVLGIKSREPAPAR